jgi:hypothetical protein
VSRTGHSRYRRNRERCKRNSDVCTLCGQWIDMDLAWPDAMSFSAHHPHSIATGGHNNQPLEATHLRCNIQAGDGRRRQTQRATIHARNW